MKKLLLLLPVLCLSTGVLAKVTYDDAVESNRPYHDYNGSIHNPPDTQGLTDAEQPNDGATGENEMGVWEYENYHSSNDNVTANRILIGTSNNMSLSDVSGAECLEGLKGYWARHHADAAANTYYYLFTCK